MTVGASRGQVVSLLGAVTTGTGTAVVITQEYKNPVIQVKGSGTITGGTIILEESFDSTYTGTWSQLASITASTLTGNALQLYHFASNIGKAVRARISSNIIGGGNVSVDLIGA